MGVETGRANSSSAGTRQSAGARRRSGVRRLGAARLTLPVALLALILIGGLASACSGVEDNGTKREDAEATASARAAGPAGATTPAGSPPAGGTPGAGETPGSGGVTLPPGDATAGQQVAQSSGCLACHSIDGSALVGPTWQGIIGRETPLEGGQTVVADAAYIRESILNPTAKIHQGFAPSMPPFQLTDQQIADIIAYMETLQ